MPPSDFAATFQAVERKSFGVAELKATGPASAGSFEAIVSVFGNVDKGGDRVVAGAFKRTLSPPPEGRGFPPIVWTHLWGVVPIGSSQKAEEVEGYKTAKGDVVDGLFVAGDLFVDEHQTAKEVYTAMTRKGGDGLPVLRDMSFGYAAVDFLTSTKSDFEAVSGDHKRDLLDVDLFEVGPTLVGMNDAASLGEAKGMFGRTLSLEHLLADLKAGARNSASDAKMLKEIHDLTTELGVACAKSAGADAHSFGALIAAKALASKGYDDVDSYAVYLLTSMIELGSNYIVNQDDQARVASMRDLLIQAAAMLGDTVGQSRNGEPEGAAFLDEIEALIPTSGEAKSTTRPTREKPSESQRELLLTFPR